MKFVLFLLAAAVFGQAVTIDAGSAAENACTGSKYTVANQADMANQAPPFNTLRYATSFSCTIPAPIGTCQVTLQFLENRPAVATATVPASGPGLRVFTAAVNGVSTGLLDLFALAGAQMPYAAPPLTVPVIDGLLHLSFTAVPGKGNASVSGVRASCTPTPTPGTSKFQSPESFAVPAGQKITVTLAKSPDPAYPMLIGFSTMYLGEQYMTFVRPDASRSLQFTPPVDVHAGTLRVGYWSLE